MIEGLMYLTASWPDIAFATFVCARYQAHPMVKHLREVKQIFGYLRQSYNMGQWYSKDFGFQLIAYSDADHAGCKDNCKSTPGGIQFLGEKLKALYGLKQAPQAWYDKLSSFMIEHHFTKDFSKRFANLMKSNFEMSMMGELKFFLGLEVHQSPHGIFISQSQYDIELLKKHGMDACVSMSTPMATEKLDADLQGTLTNQMRYHRMIEGLMYLTASWPDIAFATFVCAHADHAGCKDNCKSTPGGIQFLGEKLVSWSSKKQECTVMSFAEAEYVSLSTCCAQVIWMHTQLLDYGYKYNKIPMYCDSKSTITISCNPIQHSSGVSAASEL
nr:hypothetical protein [Tanacetum cinerariifolium]